MDFTLPEHLPGLLADMDAFIEREIAPLQAENMQYFDQRRELNVTRHLARRGAPVLAPLPGEPEVEDDFVMSFWPLVGYEPADESHRDLAAETLREVHHAFADYAGELPLFSEKIASCHALLMAEPLALAAEDRRFLLSVHEEIREIAAEPAPIHGDAGLHNLMLTDAGPLWTDFEAACLGPRSWDFAALGAGDDPLMAAARSFCVSVWCWAKADLPGKREAAEYHLSLLKQR